MIDKKPPFNIDFEKIVLGTLMADKNAMPDNDAILFEDLFYIDEHRAIFFVIQTLYRQNAPINIVTVSKELKDKASFIASLTDMYAYESLEYYIRAITELYIKRVGIDMTLRAADKFYDESNDVFETLNEIDNNISNINSKIIGKDFDNDISVTAEATFQKLINPREVKETGIRTGSVKLNNVTGGFQNGELILLCARPSHGKTTRALQFAINAALEEKKKVAFFSIEMKEEYLHKKMFSNISGIDEQTIRDQSWTSEELYYYTEAKERVRNSGIYICDHSYMIPRKLRTICRERKRKNGLDIVFIDYLQKMYPDQRSKSREREISDISTSLKNLGMELNIPVIALCQLNRTCEERTNKRPMASDLRESGSLEQDADLIMSLYSPSKYYELQYDPTYSKKQIDDDDYQLISELTILKHRNGASGFQIDEEFHKNKSLFI